LDGIAARATRQPEAAPGLGHSFRPARLFLRLQGISQCITFFVQWIKSRLGDWETGN
jgi:hypothetical protein